MFKHNVKYEAKASEMIVILKMVYVILEFMNYKTLVHRNIFIHCILVLINICLNLSQNRNV